MSGNLLTQGGNPLTTQGGDPLLTQGAGSGGAGAATPAQTTPVAGNSEGAAPSSKLYLRKMSLIVADAAGNGLELNQLHVRFQVRQFVIETPNTLTARIYNLSQQTMQLINQEFTQVILQAGYEGQYGRIFTGTLKQLRRGRENATDTYLDLFCADYDTQYNWSVINRSIAAGYTPDQVRQAALQSFGMIEPTQPGQVVNDLPDTAAPRGGVFFGMTRNTMQDLATTHNFHWNLNGSQLNMIAQSAYLPGDAVVLNSLTGMIGVPEQTQDGITVTSLLNPNIGPGSRVQINNASIQQYLRTDTVTGLNYDAKMLPISLADDGIYKVLAVDHIGDTRGNEWETQMVCIAPRGQVQPMAGPIKTSPAL